MATPSLARASLEGLCPRCGERTLFDGPLAVVGRCRACGLDLAALNIGDGPAAFLILIIGALVAGAAIAVELAFEPAWWMHAVWLPVALALTVGGLRLGKAALAFQEYRHQAREGRLSE